MLWIFRVLPVLFLLPGCRTHDAEAPAGPGDPARGFALVASHGCTSCHAHAMPGSPAREPAPRLDHAGGRLTPAALDSALIGGPRMPDCLAVLPERERRSARAALVHFLASRGGPLAPEPFEADALTVERGRQLYHSIGCVACHAPFEAAETLVRPLWDFEDAFEARASAAPETGSPAAGPRDPLALAGIAARTTTDALAAYLRDPLAVHPSGRMPSLGLSAGEAADVAAYLFYEDAASMGAVLVRGPGLLLDYHEGSFPDDTVDFDALVPVRAEVATSFFEGIARREDDFGFRFRGLIEIAAEGMHGFTTTSDDGSMLYVDGALVVDNRGQHAPSSQSGEVHLAAGRHALEVTYFEHMGGDELAVTWSGPGFAERPLGFEVLSHLEVRAPALESPAFVLEPALVERGAELYASLGCASCHEGAAPRAAPFAELDAGDGCLERSPGRGVPRYALGAQERADLAAAVREGAPPPASASERLEHELARLDCRACHARDGLGGPGDETRSFFQVASGLDLGDQGRFPPPLDRAGAKLKPAWFQAVLAGARARPYMKTRMPRFGGAADALPALFAEVDSPLRDEREPEFRAEDVEAGRVLAGTKGLGCIQCHELAGHPSIGIPAVDLARVHERIYPGWFRELLMDPAALQMNTRMPAFWVDGRSPVKDVHGGDPAAQVDALWTYLALGSSMPLPTGLVPLEGEYEVEVYDEPVCVGVFMEGVSPRTICVGLPERVHYAFDVEHSRMAKAWRGRFLDAYGTWHARAGQLEKPPTDDVLELPREMAVAQLDRPDAPWPVAVGEAAGFRGFGWRRHDETHRPIFRYQQEDDDFIAVDESAAGRVRAGGASFVRRLSAVCSVAPPERPLFFLAAVGRSVTTAEDGGFVVEGPRVHRVDVSGGYVVRISPERSELRAPLRFEDMGMDVDSHSYRATLEAEYSW